MGENAVQNYLLISVTVEVGNPAKTVEKVSVLETLNIFVHAAFKIKIDSVFIILEHF